MIVMAVMTSVATMMMTTLTLLPLNADEIYQTGTRQRRKHKLAMATSSTHNDGDKVATELEIEEH